MKQTKVNHRLLKKDELAINKEMTNRANLDDSTGIFLGGAIDTELVPSGVMITPPNLNLTQLAASKSVLLNEQSNTGAKNQQATQGGSQRQLVMENTNTERQPQPSENHCCY